MVTQAWLTYEPKLNWRHGETFPILPRGGLLSRFDEKVVHYNVVIAPHTSEGGNP
jgi:hypothetical protein